MFNRLLALVAVAIVAAGSVVYYASESTLVPSRGGRVGLGTNGTIIYDGVRADTGNYGMFKFDCNAPCNGTMLLPASYTTLQIGNPTVYTDNTRVIFQCQDVTSVVSAAFASPGVGIDNDLCWYNLSTGTTGILYQLGTINGTQGSLHPTISDDGNWVVWGHYLGTFAGAGNQLGYYELDLAPLTVSGDGFTTITSPTVYWGGAGGSSTCKFIEPSDFENGKVLFASNCSGQSAYYMDVCEMTVVSGGNAVVKATAEASLVVLTDPALTVWDEFGAYSNNRTRIVWSRSWDNTPSSAATAYLDAAWMPYGAGYQTPRRITTYNQSALSAIVADTEIDPSGNIIARLGTGAGATDQVLRIKYFPPSEFLSGIYSVTGRVTIQ